MPRQIHNVGRQRSTSYAVTINGLLTARGRQLQALRLGTGKNTQANIDAIDHVLVNVLAYEGDIAEASRDFRRETTFKRGELRKAVADVLRGADRPLTTLEVAKAVYGAKGVEVSYSRKIKNRVNTVLKVLKAMHGKCRVCKGIDSQGGAAWLVSPIEQNYSSKNDPVNLSGL